MFLHIRKKKKLLIIFSVIILSLWTLNIFLKILRLNAILNDLSFIDLRVELMCLPIDNERKIYNKILSCKNIFTTKLLFNQLENQKYYDEKKLCVLLLMMSTVDEYSKYQTQLNSLFYKAFINSDDQSLILFSYYLSYLADRKSMDLIKMLLQRRETSLVAFLTLIKMQYPIQKLMVKLRQTDISTLIFLLSFCSENYNIKYIKKIFTYIDSLLCHTISRMPIQFQSLSPELKLLLIKTWLDRDCNLTECFMIINGISENSFNNIEDKIHLFSTKIILHSKAFWNKPPFSSLGPVFSLGSRLGSDPVKSESSSLKK